MPKNYLSVTYDEKSHPYTDYPKKLCAYLFQSFELKEGMKMLEPGCGRGEFLGNFKDLGLDVYGVDISPEAQEYTDKFPVEVCDIENEKLPFDDNTFDVGWLWSETKKYFSLTFKQENLRNLSTPINDLIGVSLGVILLWIGANEVIVHGNLTPDGFIRFIIYLFAMLQPARKLGNVNAQIQGGLASAERVFSIIDIESNITNPIHPVEIQEFTNHIKFNNVSFQYENSENLILSSININIHRGEVLALVGSSGAGKSTFADLIPRFYDVSSGEIIIDGIDIRKLTVENLRSLMGIVSQDTILFNDTVAHNISYGLPEAGIDEIRQAAKTANALEFIDNLPNGFDTIIGEKGTRLSGGQRQRISIARALLKNPDILILDEATSALDTESERKVQEAIDTLVQNRTVIVIAHRLSTITKADQIIVLDEGKIVESGTHKKLLEINGHYKHLYNIQFGGSGK